MKTLITTICILCLAASAFAEDAAPDQTMSRLAQSSREQLNTSTKELNQLREQIASEKLPLGQQLTELEDKLSQLRRKNDTIARQVDTGTLEMTNIKAQMKVRQDEQSYIGNLLDEYARTFESKINPTEMQYLGAAIENAKDATADTKLPMEEKFTRQIAFVNRSIERLFDAVGGMRFKGVGVDMQGSVVDGQFALVGPVALFSGNSGGTAGLVIQQAGSTRPLIRPLEGPMQAGIAPLVDGGEGMMPFDPSRGAALKALIQKTNLFHIFEKGGPIMWPLLAASILALGTVLERLLFLMIERLKRSRKTLQKFLKAVEVNDFDGAIAISKKSRYFIVRALAYSLQHREESMTDALLYAQARELKRFRRGIPILDTVITLAPLLGLLGTVVGMMGSFSLIGGDLSAPGAITGGIAEALIATAFGLGIAITALLPFNFLNARIEDARHELEAAATQFNLMFLANGPAAPDKHVAPPSNGTNALSASAPHAAQQGNAIATISSEHIRIQEQNIKRALGSTDTRSKATVEKGSAVETLTAPSPKNHPPVPAEDPR